MEMEERPAGVGFGPFITGTERLLSWARLRFRLSAASA